MDSTPYLQNLVHQRFEITFLLIQSGYDRPT